MGNIISGGGSSTPAPSAGPIVGRKLNDSVYLLHGPEQPQVEVVFIHGLQAEDYKDAYWQTWLVRDGSECWPATWLKTRMPRARIFSLSYDSSALGSPFKGDKGTMDLYLLGEKLLQEMLSERIGQNDCPVVFVCHSLGGLVAKSIIRHARRLSPSDDDYAASRALLQNTRGFFFYATPHLGSELVEYFKNVSVLYSLRGAVVDNLEVLCKNSSELNTDFEQARSNNSKRWDCFVIGESHRTKVLQCRIIPYQRIVSEASARLVGVKYMEVSEDHINVCKPNTPVDTSFQKLVHFVKNVCTELQLEEIEVLSSHFSEATLTPRTESILESVSIKEPYHEHE